MTALDREIDAHRERAPIAPETLAEWRRVTEAATPGEWRQHPRVPDVVIEWAAGVGVATFDRIADGAFACVARAAMPALLDEVERMTREDARTPAERRADEVLAAQRAKGRAKYGKGLDHAEGRDWNVMALEELADAVQYLAAENVRVRAELEAERAKVRGYEAAGRREGEE